MKTEVTTLKNKSKIIGVKIPSSKSVAIYFGFRTGSREEAPEEAGISHYLEHMMFKGSQKRKTAIAISREFDNIGAQVNAATSKEYTYYHIKTIPENFDLALDIIGDMVTRPILDQKEVKKESGAIIQELLMNNDNPSIDIFSNIEKVLFGPKTNMGRAILGIKKTILNIDSKKLKRYYKKKYVGENCVCVIVGNLPNKYGDKAQSYLNRLPRGVKTEWDQPSYSKNRLLIKHKKTDQSTFGVAIPAYKLTDSHRHTLEVATTILSGMGMMSNRLFTKIREKRGWAYIIWGYNSPDSDSGYFGIYGGIKKDKMEDTVEIIKKELLSFSKTVTDEEIKRAKGFLKGSQSLRYDDIDGIATYVLLHCLLINEIRLPQRDIEAYEKVTKKDIKRVADDLFAKENLYLTVIGPYQNKEKFAKILTR